MENEKCRIKGNRIYACQTLSRALEYGNPQKRSKGIFIPERVSIKTFERGTDIAQIHSGEFVGRGIAINFCPFCGENLKTWEQA